MIICNVMSYSEAQKASYELSEKTAIISINNPDVIPYFPEGSENLIGTLILNFGDIEEDSESSMSSDDAEKIRDFLSDVLPKIERLIVHCEMGVSRSAGVAAAILKALTGDDMSVFNDKFLVPNMHCYRLVLNKLLGEDGNSVLGYWDMKYK